MIIPETATACKDLPPSFGSADDTIPGGMFGNYILHGKPPWGLSSSMEAVRDQKEDVPNDFPDPYSRSDSDYFIYKILINF